MRTEDEIRAAARPGRAFSNGTEGYAWMDNWCGECVHDSIGLPSGGGEPPWCPLIGLAMTEDLTPSEWIEQEWQSWTDDQGVEHPPAPSLGDTYHCVEFRQRDDGGDDPDAAPDPGPLPEVEGQLDIFAAFIDAGLAELPDRELEGAR